MCFYLQPMTELDLSWVLSIEKQAYPHPWSKAGFEQVLERGLAYTFVDEKTQCAVGYSCLLPIVDEIELLNFCIAPPYQGQGVGKRTLVQLMQKLTDSGYQKVLLEVRVSNHSAQKLYQRVGFVQDGIRKNYYRDGAQKEDAILMSYVNE